jgi:protein-disulfide isomerase
MSRLSLIAVFALGIAASTWYVTRDTGPQGGANVSAASLLGAAHAQTVEEIDTSTVQEMSLGNPEAPVTIIEYASYTCPHCANFHAGSFKQLKTDYIDTGKVHFIYREVYFDRYGLWASAIARCAGTQQSFFGISDMIYSGLDTWARAGEPALIVEELRKIGLLGGLEKEPLEACLQDGEKLQTLVAWFQENADRDGIRSSPSFLINGQLYGNMPYSEFQGVIDAALEDG